MSSYIRRHASLSALQSVSDGKVPKKLEAGNYEKTFY